MNLLLLIGTNFEILIAQTEISPRVKLELLNRDEELRIFYLNFSVKYAGFLSSNLWTLTHSYESKAEMEIVLNYFTAFFSAIDSNNAKEIEKIGDIKAFKDKFVEFLDSKDDAVRAFSAVVLGIAGDREYAAQIVKLVNERDESFSKKYSDQTPGYRGRACVALGILQATEYKADIAKLLSSENNYDRSGAVHALGQMNATEYTKEIVSLLTSEKFQFDDDDSPIHFLIDTKQAQNYKKELVTLMLGEFRSEVAKSSAYALAAIDAKEHAKDVAKLLTIEFRKGAGAKVLALLGAKQYIPQIATLLNDKNGLVRADAITSLGILEASKYATKISEFLTEGEKDYIAVYAAEAIFLMRAKAHYTKARHILSFKLTKRPLPMAVEFHDFVTDKTEKIRQKLETAINSSDYRS